MPYNPGRYIRLEKEPTTNQEVAQFRAELRNLTNDSLAADGDQYSEQRFLDVKRIIERFRGRDGLRRRRQGLDPAGHRRAQLVRLLGLRALASRPTRSGSTTATPTASPAARRRSSPTRSWPRPSPTSSGSSGVPSSRATSDSRSSTRRSAAARMSLDALRARPVRDARVCSFSSSRRCRRSTSSSHTSGQSDSSTIRLERSRGCQTMTIEEYRTRRDGR